MATSGQFLSADGQIGAPRRDFPQDRMDRPLAAFARDYPEGDTGLRHRHARAQLLYATAGIMRITTEAARFTVPPARALWLPAGLRRLAAALAADPASALTLEDWALRCGASPRTLRRLFHAETGMGFARWRQGLRPAEAAALIADGMAPARAAAAVGYASAPAFGAAFRAAFGTTPGAEKPARGRPGASAAPGR
jgi:transcriptional regulator GlxA family with amidase domain